jgi:membrane protease YdiL (CAAX protease family)
LQIVHYAIIFGEIVIAILFAGFFRYSARDLGIPFKHWRIYLGLIIIAFPIGKFLQGEYFHMGIGAVSLLMLFVLYLSNRERWQGLANDLISLRPFALPIILCALLTFGLVWVQYSSQVPWSLPFRVFDTYTLAQGAMPEEFYYRLGVQTRLTSFIPFGWASLLQGVVFSASHFPQALATGDRKIGDLLWSFTPGIANALAGGYFWYRSKNLPAAILFHMAVFI